MNNEYILKMNGIIKEFTGVRVLHNVNFKVKKGEIHAIVGENGAGKSTLMKILSGIYPYGQYEGSIILEESEVRFNSVKSSEEAGIEIIHQELELVPYMSVGENIFLGNEPKKGILIDYNALNKRSLEILKRVNLHVKPNVMIHSLGVGKRQLVAIAKALSKEVKILILDEPTSALTEEETDNLLNILRELKRQGVTCIYISHKLQEVLKIADTVTVLRDGRSIITEPVKDMTEDKMIKYMVGREITNRFPREACDIGDTVLSVKNFSVIDPETNEKIIDDISFDVRKGEILGVSGLMGAGSTELVMSIFGAAPYVTKGDIYINGEKVEINSPLDAIKMGIGLVTEDRKDYGLVQCLDIIKNTTLSSLDNISSKGIINKNMEIKKACDFVESLSIRAPSLELEAERLSGGNQQKVVLAKTLMTNPSILIMDEPTRGIDVGAKYEIYMIMNRLIQKGVAIIMISSELPEILGMSDRVMVINCGKKAGELDRENADQETIMTYATSEVV